MRSWGSFSPAMYPGAMYYVEAFEELVHYTPGSPGMRCNGQDVG